MAYLHCYHENGLNEETCCEADRKPEEDSQDVRDQKDSAYVDGERSNRFLLFEDLQLWDVGRYWENSHGLIGFELPKSAMSMYDPMDNYL